MKKRFILACLLAALLALTACGASDNGGGIVTGQLTDSGDLRIEKASVGEKASFINYDANGVTVQLIAVKAGDGTVRIAYNTCQSCNPSPLAYFVQEGSRFICQNCENEFTAEDVGASAWGCNPLPVERVTETDDALIVAASELESMRARFEGWGGPTK